MAKNGELASVVSSKIWRTIVVAGAMLGAPIVVGCGGGNKPAPAAPAETDKAATDPDHHGIDNDAAKGQADVEAKAAADKAAADQVAADQAAADSKAQADKDAADQAAADEAAKKKRPRTNSSRPSGRGFILS